MNSNKEVIHMVLNYKGALQDDIHFNNWYVDNYEGLFHIYKKHLELVKSLGFNISNEELDFDNFIELLYRTS